jgi:hypothetical protein
MDSDRLKAEGASCTDHSQHTHTEAQRESCDPILPTPPPPAQRKHGGGGGGGKGAGSMHPRKAPSPPYVTAPTGPLHSPTSTTGTGCAKRPSMAGKGHDAGSSCPPIGGALVGGVSNPGTVGAAARVGSHRTPPRTCRVTGDGDGDGQANGQSLGDTLGSGEVLWNNWTTQCLQGWG